MQHVHENHSSCHVLFQKFFVPDPTPPMDLLPVDEFCFSALLQPLLETQRELTRTTEIILQLDDLSDFTYEQNMIFTDRRLNDIRVQMQSIQRDLKVRLLIQVFQLHRRLRAFLHRHNRLPHVPLNFRF